jgi:hypothetical protein
MSDERDLTPEQEARVARLLAEARADEPIPQDVAARLDRVLAGMQSEQITGPGRQIAPVIDLAARRRRRAGMLLAAAAAVIVAGVGIGQVVGPDRGDDANNSASDEAGGQDNQPADNPQASAAPNGMSEQERATLGPPTRITAKSFATAVRRLQSHAGIRSEASAGVMMNGEDLAPPDTDYSCGLADYGDGKLMAVFYNGSPAVLAYRPPGGDTQVVELLQCGSGEAIRSTTIPLP